jgi:hypothetical protein
MHGNITKKLPVQLSLSQTSKKSHLFLFYLLSFFFHKIGEQEGRTSPARETGWHQKEGGSDGERR